MYVSEIWRYPLKSTAGESLQRVEVTALGIAGDRIVQVQDEDGNILTSRTFPDLLGLHSSLDEQGEPLVDGRPWTDRHVLAKVRAIVGRNVKLLRGETFDRFDVLPLLVATDGAIAAFGRDRRRLRPNIIVGGVDGLAERTWPGKQLLIRTSHKPVVIGIADLRGRCNMTTFDPDTLEQDMNVLRDIVKRFGGKLALNCDVIVGGIIEVGREVELHDPSAPSP